MNKLKLLLVFTIIFNNIYLVQSQKVSCAMIGTAKSTLVHGMTTIEKVDDESILLLSSTSGLDIGVHGIHIHQYGDLSKVDGSSAGGHFGTGGHTCDPNTHIGDLGNIRSTHAYGDDFDGAYWSKSLDTTRYSNIFSSNSDDNIIGRAIVIHEKQNDCSNSSAAGARVAYCVIGKNNEPESIALQFSGPETNATCTFLSGSGSVSGIVNFQKNETEGFNGTEINGAFFDMLSMSSMTLDLVDHGELFTSENETVISTYNISSGSLSTSESISFYDMVGRSLRLSDKNGVTHLRCVIGVTKVLPNIAVSNHTDNFSTTNSDSDSSSDEISSNKKLTMTTFAYSKTGLIVGIVMAVCVLIAFAVYTIRKNRMKNQPGFQRVYGEF